MSEAREAGPTWKLIAVGMAGVILTLLGAAWADIRSGQARIEAKADEAIRQSSAGRQELQAISSQVAEQKEATSAALERLRFFRSDDDKEWQAIKSRVLALEIEGHRRQLEDNRRHDRGEDWRP